MVWSTLQYIFDPPNVHIHHVTRAEKKKARRAKIQKTTLKLGTGPITSHCSEIKESASFRIMLSLLPFRSLKRDGIIRKLADSLISEQWLVIGPVPSFKVVFWILAIFYRFKEVNTRSMFLFSFLHF